MSRLRVHAFSISIDGYGAGPTQNRDNPLGEGGEALHNWIIATRTFSQIQGGEGGTTGIVTTLWNAAWLTLVPGFWAVTCSGRFEVRGPTTRGRAGGEVTHRITSLFSS